MRRVKQLAQQYIAWATDQFNSDLKLIPAEVRLNQFCDDRHIDRETATALYWHLVNLGVC